MSVEIKRLEPGEWNLLRKTYDGYAPDPQKSVAVVAVSDAGDIVGRIFLVAPAHIEGIWIDQDWRNKTLFWQLVQHAEEEARNEGIKTLLCFAANPEMADYIGRLEGYEYLPWSVWKKELK